MRDVVYELNYYTLENEIVYCILDGEIYEKDSLINEKGENINEHSTKAEVEDFLRDDEIGCNFFQDESQFRFDCEIEDINSNLRYLVDENFDKNKKGEREFLILYDDRDVQYDYGYIESLDYLLKSLRDYSFDEIKISCIKNVDMVIELNNSYRGGNNEIKIINLDLETNTDYDIGDIIEFMRDSYYHGDFEDYFFDHVLEPYLDRNGYYDSVSKYLSWWFYDVNSEWHKLCKEFVWKHRCYHRTLYNLDYWEYDPSICKHKTIFEQSFEEIFQYELSCIPEDGKYEHIINRFEDAFNTFIKYAKTFYENVYNLNDEDYYKEMLEEKDVFNNFSYVIENMGAH